MKTFALAAAAALSLTYSASAETLVMQSVYPSSLPLLGDSGINLTKQVEALTNGELKIEFNEPGAIVGGNEMWDAISTGAVDAGWYSPGFAQGIIPSAAIFTAVPFGPDIRAYTAWWYYGGGKEVWADITAKYNIHTELCAILVPEASGWFAKEINKPEDLKGVKMRIFGLGAAVMGKLGVEAQSMPVADTMTGLRLGTIDAAEVSFPLIDKAVGMNEYAKHYYFPGWHQQTSLITFIANQDVWDGLSEQQRTVIQTACQANVAMTAAEGEAKQLQPLEDLKAAGVQVHQWNDEMMGAFSKAWDEVAAEQAAADPDFKRAWESLSNFRATFKTWSDLAYLK
ncbi:TRAP transporter substrate-binding protein [Roseibium suaedae]|uniref:TRAP-type mannitol/chloroaromatic compound transport system, substrate-binding protein n=1 Tax=Roseibium suaedae TaxID=735517 RepID=A0A1M7J5Z8_9HYPH|nr:TRAP transporter substrate-binding protein [Roseibium suaedae]SHM47867.1 TRAP-type mannitol/chloroaromatic compound transport system, substrate-binding protein [Roseibium suaedae]